MPGVEDWTHDPFTIIDRVFGESGTGETVSKEWAATALNFFNKDLNNEEFVKQLPSIPETPLHQLRDGQVVRFRCQVQDMLEPEFYIKMFKVVDAAGNTTHKPGRYRDVISCKAGEKLVSQCPNEGFDQREVLYCISMPGQSPWVTEELAAQNCGVSAGNGGGGGVGGRKRPLDEDGAMDTDDGMAECDESKRARVAVNVATATAFTTASGAVNASADGASTHGCAVLNFPVSNEKGIGCFVKFYENAEQYRLNDVLEVIGLLSVNPALATEVAEDDTEHFSNPSDRLPPSLVPRLHVLSARPLPHNNPLLPPGAPVEGLEGARETRELLRLVLEEACLGDPLAGDFFVAHLLASVNSRQDSLALGKLCLNLSGVTPALSEAGYPGKLFSLLQQLTTHAHFLPFTTETLNTMVFIPQKDYTLDRLTSGLLQLPRHTHLILDETAMTDGQLDAKGVRNLEQMANVIRHQQCQYDFHFHQIQQPTDLSILVVSEGKSMLPCDCELPLQPQHSDVSAAFTRVAQLLAPADALPSLRRYLTTARLAHFDLTTEMQAELQEEFVEARKQNKEAMSVDTFHRLLVLARLVSVSCGETLLTRDVWQSCRILDTQRQQRITALNRHTTRPSVNSL